MFSASLRQGTTIDTGMVTTSVASALILAWQHSGLDPPQGPTDKNMGAGHELGLHCRRVPIRVAGETGR